jgi:16S rRNA (guanine1207-N2)-methyltransferase
VENASELILRNADRLAKGPLLLVNPPRDSLSVALRNNGRTIRLHCQDFGDFSWQRELDAEAIFSTMPALEGDEVGAILFLPREKDRLAMLAHALATQLAPDGRLWLVGENRAGIRSAGRHLARYFGHVSTLDKARHCALIEATEPVLEPAFRIEDYVTSWSVDYAGECIELRYLPGVFAHGRLDRGTALLLDELTSQRIRGRVLDFACGSGVVGLAALAIRPDCELTLLDSSAPALDSTRLSLAANRHDATLIASDGLSELSGRYDFILSNLPFHSGVRSDLDVAADFFRCAGTFLAENGKIIVVFNRHLPYLRWMQQAFREIERLNGNDEFTVLQASRPRAR